MGYSGAGGKLIHDKKTSSKKSRRIVPLSACTHLEHAEHVLISITLIMIMQLK
jgi:hypothetical protein